MLMIHSFLTDGFYDWAEIFLKSFKYHNSTTHPIILSTRGLTSQHIESLESLYDNIIILNEDFDWELISDNFGMSISDIQVIKNEIESGERVTAENVIWKQYVSVEQRFRNTILEVMGGNNYMLHMDIDHYFKNDITPLLNIIKENDICIKIREKDVAGGVIGFTINDRTKSFMNEWVNEIDKLDIKDKPRAYGQASLYNVYKRMKHDLKWFNITNDIFDVKGLEQDALFWSGGRITKKDALKEYKEDFKKYDY
jgi:hypothetical protein